MSGAAGSLPPFQEFLEANRATVYRFLVVAVGPQDADDTFQETFIAALRAYPTVREPGKLDRWVLAIASRKAIDHHRRANRRPLPTAEAPESTPGTIPARATRTTRCGRPSASSPHASGWRSCTGTCSTVPTERSRS